MILKKEYQETILDKEDSELKVMPNWQKMVLEGLYQTLEQLKKRKGSKAQRILDQT